MAMRPRQKKRLGQTDWLALAMDVVAKEGGAKLTIDSLCRKLGVTKGSFYAHFESRADFVRQIVAYWRENFTQSVIDTIDELEDATAEARLLALMQLLHRERMAGYEVAVRAWAAHDLTVTQGVQETDRLRFKFVRRIFHDMGFRGADLDLRTRLFVVYHSGEPSMHLPSSGLSAEEELKLRHEFFTRA